MRKKRQTKVLKPPRHQSRYTFGEKRRSCNKRNTGTKEATKKKETEKKTHPTKHVLGDHAGFTGSTRQPELRKKRRPSLMVFFFPPHEKLKMSDREANHHPPGFDRDREMINPIFFFSGIVYYGCGLQPELAVHRLRTAVPFSGDKVFRNCVRSVSENGPIDGYILSLLPAKRNGNLGEEKTRKRAKGLPGTHTR